jgi:hypothetical protein
MLPMYVTYPLCADRTRLLIAYQRANSDHAHAVSDLVAAGIPAYKYQRLSAIAQEARKAAQGAREELKRHIAEHGCQAA